MIAGFFLLLCSAAAAIVVSSEQQRAGASLRHTLVVQSDLDDVRILATDAETGERGFLLAGRGAYLEPYRNARSGIEAALDKLAADTVDDPRQHNDFIELRRLVGVKIAELSKKLSLRGDGGSEGPIDVRNSDAGRQTMADIRQICARMQNEELNRLKRKTAQYENWNRLSQVVLLVTPFIVLAIGALSVMDGQRRIQEVLAANERLMLEANERRSAESQLRQVQKMEAIGQLTGGIAHDFNNMLAVVMGSLDMARRRLDAGGDPGVSKYIDRAAEGAQRAATLAARLLAFSRRQALEPTVIDPNELVAGVLELLHRTIGETIFIETIFAADLWSIHTDVSQLENALVNLTVNARDAMPDGGTLTIETANIHLDNQYVSKFADLSSGQYVMISVTDNGMGMAATVMQKAFEPFYTTKEVGRGTGLGLSQVYGFAKQSGGHVALHSEFGVGTTVKIYIPRHVGSEEPCSVPGESEIRRGAIGELILVVEDEESVRRMAVDMLRELGYSVVDASCGAEALTCISRQPGIKLLFTDVVMPGINGQVLADLAVSNHPGMKVIYTTGYAPNAVVQNDVVRDEASLLPKPFTMAQLAAKVRQTLDT